MIDDAKSCPTAQNWSGALAGHAAAETPLQRQHSPNTTDNHRSAVRDAELPIFHSHKEASSLDKPPQQFWCLSTPCILLNQSYRSVSKDRSFLRGCQLHSGRHRGHEVSGELVVELVVAIATRFERTTDVACFYI